MAASPAAAACQAPTHQIEVTGPESIMSMDASKRRSATGGHSAAGGEARSSHERSPVRDGHSPVRDGQDFEAKATTVRCVTMRAQRWIK